MSTTEKGAAAGGVIGAGSGAIIGHQVGHTAGGALIGGAVGALAGGLIGSTAEQPAGKTQTYQNRQAYKQSYQSPCDAAYADFSRARSSQRTDDKIYYYKKGLRLCPDYYDAHYELGLLYKRLGNIEEAKYEFRRTLEIKPEHYDAREALRSLGY